jgi:hypothetical protein
MDPHRGSPTRAGHRDHPEAVTKCGSYQFPGHGAGALWPPTATDTPAHHWGHTSPYPKYKRGGVEALGAFTQIRAKWVNLLSLKAFR